MLPGIVLSIIPPLTSVTILAVNLFLVWRYFRLTKRLWLSGLLIGLALAAQGCISWAISITIKFFSADLTNLPALIHLLDQGEAAAKAGLAMEVAMITAITLLLLVHLLSYLKNDLQDTRRMLIRLILVTMESGLVATTLAITNLVYLILYPTSTNLIILALCTARVYSMGMLFNLNTRGEGGFVMRDSAGHSRPASGQVGGFSRSKTSPSRSAQHSNVGTVVLENVVDTYQAELNLHNFKESSTKSWDGEAAGTTRKAGVTFA